MMRLMVGPLRTRATVAFALLALVVTSFALFAAPVTAEKIAGSATGGRPLTADLTGAAEVSGGDADGSGSAIVTLNHGQGLVCWEITVADIAPAFAAHIHAAPAGVNGGVVVPLSPTSGCASADPALIKAIMKDPGSYYVNVHNADFPGGAVRGQLSK